MGFNLTKKKYVVAQITGKPKVYFPLNKRNRLNLKITKELAKYYKTKIKYVVRKPKGAKRLKSI